MGARQGDAAVTAPRNAAKPPQPPARIGRPPERVRLNKAGLFVCPRHAGELTLSPTGCARLYQRAQDAKRTHDVVDLGAVRPCLACKIGAKHASADPQSTRSAPVFVPLAVEPRELRLQRARSGGRSTQQTLSVRPTKADPT